MMKNIKNIVVINDFNYVQGGASKVAIDTANLLCNDCNVYFFSGDGKEDNDLDEKVINVCTYQGEALKEKNKIKGSINGIYNYKAKSELKKLLSTLDKNDTVIHVHGWTKCLSCSIFDISWKMGFKLILTLHDYFSACPNGGYFNYCRNRICKLDPLSIKCIRCNCDSRNYFFKIYRVARQFVQNKIVKLNDRLKYAITISDFSENILRKTLNPEIKIYRVYNPINFMNEVMNDNLEKDDYYLYVGRISKEKGVDIFCKAISELKLKGIVVGDGSEKTILKNKYSFINFVGWKNSNEVKEYMSKAKALVFPSLWYETMGLTVIEAQSLGCYVIVNCDTAAKEFIFNPELGTIYNGIDDLKEKINDFENNKQNINNISVNDMKNIFSNEKYLRTVSEIYENLNKL